MAFDFPTNPALDYIYTSPDGVAYIWNGYAWIKSGVPSGGAQYVLRAGDTMTGPLTLNADPVDPMGAATKQYVDSKLGSI